MICTNMTTLNKIVNLPTWWGPGVLLAEDQPESVLLVQVFGKPIRLHKAVLAENLRSELR